MFEPFEHLKDDVSILLVGVGTVGCRIASAMEDIKDIDKLYIHSSEETLRQYTVDGLHDSVYLNDQVYFQEAEIKSKLIGRDILFVTAGLGGETGSSVAPYISKLAQELGILCVGLCSFPFEFEGRYKKYLSHQAYLALSSHIDSLICIDNDRFLDSNIKQNQISGIGDIFHDSNSHFDAVTKGLTNLLTKPGMINVDFINIKTIFGEMGLATVGHSITYGEERAAVAVKTLLGSPAMKNYSLSQARGCLVSITAGLDMRLDEFEVIGNAVKDILGENATVVIGTSLDPKMENSIAVTIIITGLPELPIDRKLARNNFDLVKLSKSIQFEAHQASAGLSILSYFNNFLHQKYAGIEAKVNIHQQGSKVTLIVETASGEFEKIEKSLYEFGLIVVGKKAPEEVLNSKADVEQLQMKLEFAALELKQNARLISAYEEQKNDYKSRVISLEQRVDEMQKVICNSLASSQKQQLIQIQNGYQLPSELINLLNKHSSGELSLEAQYAIELEVRRQVTSSDRANSLKDLADNVFYGVAGNSMYSLLTGILATLPR